MKKLGIPFAVMLFFIGAGAVNLHANPLPLCTDAWCHYTKPEIGYDEHHDDFHILLKTDDNKWWKTNCPNWPETTSILNLPQRIQWDYGDGINALWEKNHPEDKGVVRGGQEKIREEQYLADQKEKYGRNIPYCLTEEAQERVQQERRKTEEYLRDAHNVPMVRDRLAMLAKIEEANAKTAKELGLEDLYKAPPKWQIDKATLDAWWAETHPNGSFLDKQAIKQRYKDYFEKQTWKKAHPNDPEPSIEEIKQQNKDDQRRAKENFENEKKNWWNENCADEPEQNYFKYMNTAYFHYYKDVDNLWLKYHKTPMEPRVISGIVQRYEKVPKFPVPFEEREKFYRSKQQDLYGKQVPYCLAQSMRNNLEKEKQELQQKLDREKERNERNAGRLTNGKNLLGDFIHPQISEEEFNKQQQEKIKQQEEKIEKITMELMNIQRAIDATSQIAAKLGLDLNLELDPLRDPSVSFPSDAQKIVDFVISEIHEEILPKRPNEQKRIMNMLYTGLVALGIVIGAAILLRRKKNLPK